MALVVRPADCSREKFHLIAIILFRLLHKFQSNLHLASTYALSTIWHMVTSIAFCSPR